MWSNRSRNLRDGTFDIPEFRVISDGPKDLRVVLLSEGLIANAHPTGHNNFSYAVYSCNITRAIDFFVTGRWTVGSINCHTNANGIAIIAIIRYVRIIFVKHEFITAGRSHVGDTRTTWVDVNLRDTIKRDDCDLR